jgi:hypothetical protein
VIKTHRKAFDSLVILVALSLWLQRNDRVFNRASLLEALLSSSILANLDQWVRAKLVVRLQLLGD